MQLERLILKNFRQHADRVLDFGLGLVAILGPNNSGKSNLFVAIQYALTGKFPAGRAKDGNICLGAAADEPAYVDLTWSHRGQRCQVRRQLRSAKTVLSVGTEQLTGDARTTERIFQMLGTDPETFTQIFLVEQGALFGFLDQTPAVRQAAFQRFFGLESAASLCELLGKRLASIVPPDVSGLEAARQAARLASQQAQQARQAWWACYEEIEAQGLQTDVNPVGQMRALDQVYCQTQREVREYGQAQAEAKYRDDISRQVQVLTAEDAVGREDARVAGLQLADAELRLQGLVEPAEAARRLIVQLQQTQRLVDRRGELERELVKLPPAEPGRLAAELANIQQALVQLAAEEVQTTAFLRSFRAADGTALCPTCGTRVTGLDVLVPEKQRQAVQLQQGQRDLCSSQQELQQLQRDQQRREQLVNELQSLQGFTPETPGGLQAARDALAAWTQAQTKQQSAAWRVAAVEERNRQRAVRLHDLADQLRVSPVQILDTVKAEQAVQRLAWLESRLPEYRAVAAATELAAQVCVQTGLQEAQLQQQQQQAERVEAWRQLCLEMRELVHHQASPRFVVQRNLEVLATPMNEFLELFEADFRVEASEGATYRAYFAGDMESLPAEWLSFGKKVLLAFAFRAALNTLHHEIGFLALDEPTAYLDEPSIAGFEPVLSRLRQITADSQCIFITHEERLAPLFDQVVRL